MGHEDSMLGRLLHLKQNRKNEVKNEVDPTSEYFKKFADKNPQPNLELSKFTDEEILEKSGNANLPPSLQKDKLAEDLERRPGLN